MSGVLLEEQRIVFDRYLQHCQPRDSPIETWLMVWILRRHRCKIRPHEKRPRSVRPPTRQGLAVVGCMAEPSPFHRCCDSVNLPLSPCSVLPIAYPLSSISCSLSPVPCTVSPIPYPVSPATYPLSRVSFVPYPVFPCALFPCHLTLVPYPLSPIPYCLLLVPCPLFPIPLSLTPCPISYPLFPNSVSPFPRPLSPVPRSMRG